MRDAAVRSVFVSCVTEKRRKKGTKEGSISGSYFSTESEIPKIGFQRSDRAGQRRRQQPERLALKCTVCRAESEIRARRNRLRFSQRFLESHEKAFDVAKASVVQRRLSRGGHSGAKQNRTAYRTQLTL